MDPCLQLGEGVLLYGRAVIWPVFCARPPLRALSVTALVNHRAPYGLFWPAQVRLRSLAASVRSPVQRFKSGLTGILQRLQP